LATDINEPMSAIISTGDPLGRLSVDMAPGTYSPSFSGTLSRHVSPRACCVHINGTESVHPVLLRIGKSTERNERLCGIGDISTSEQCHRITKRPCRSPHCRLQRKCSQTFRLHEFPKDDAPPQGNQNDMVISGQGFYRWFLARNRLRFDFATYPSSIGHRSFRRVSKLHNSS